ncbi:MAG: FAD-binding oxidoreductase [Dehalococcoidia bacterium]|nr:FAD-binding oxidoreductase [Dehalococcoidia bacterium]
MRENPNRANELVNLLGDAISTSPLECELYAHDLAAVPSLLAKALVRATPDAVARPRTVEEVSALLKYASTHRLPVTPRASGSTAFHNAVPTNGGILLDLNAFRGIKDVDTARQTATVLAATRWKDLDDELRYRWGLAVKTYPTSAPSATVGGWFNMGGQGVGSIKYGHVRDLVERAEAVLPSGEVKALGAESDPPLSWFSGTEGTLGIVTSLSLSLRQAPEAVSSHLLSFADLAALQRTAIALSNHPAKPYHLHFADEAYSRMAREAGLASPTPAGLHSLFVRYEGSEAEMAAGASHISVLTRENGGTAFSGEIAAEEWQHRFSEVRIKRAGPTLLGVEVLLPLSRLAQFIAAVQNLGRGYGVSFCTYGSIVSVDYVQPNVFFPTDERRGFPYLLSLSLTKKLHDVAHRLGGRPYGVGLWNTPYLGQAYPARELEELRRRKRLLDPSGIMNPGKLYAPPLPLTQPFFGLAMDALALMFKTPLVRGNGQEARMVPGP